MALTFDPNDVVVALRPHGRCGGEGTLDFYKLGLWGKSIAMPADEIEELKADKTWGPLAEAVITARDGGKRK